MEILLLSEWTEWRELSERWVSAHVSWLLRAQLQPGRSGLGGTGPLHWPHMSSSFLTEGPVVASTERQEIPKKLLSCSFLMLGSCGNINIYRRGGKTQTGRRERQKSIIGVTWVIENHPVLTSLYDDGKLRHRDTVSAHPGVWLVQDSSPAFHSSLGLPLPPTQRGVVKWFSD